jgi:hypothetical protein
MLDLNGENPASVNKGSSYVDLGARIINTQDQNLGIKAIVDGHDVGDQSLISIDTTTVGSHTIEFYAVDQAGNRGSIQRTVNVIDPYATASSTPATPNQSSGTSDATGQAIDTTVSTSTSAQ